MHCLNIFLKDCERLDDLQYKGLKIIQNKNFFCFGIDAVLLSDFTDVHTKDSVLDIGTGNAIIPILLSGRSMSKKIIGIEIQPEIAELARRNIILNRLEERVSIVTGDIKDSLKYFAPSSFNVIVSNPPYMNSNGGLVSISKAKAIARHEISCTLDDIIREASKLLINNGQFAMVHRPHRLVDIIYTLRKYSLEPKYLRFVHPSPYKKANLLLIKAFKYGNPELKMMEPLYVYDENNNYTSEINKIYHREENKA